MIQQVEHGIGGDLHRLDHDRQARVESEVPVEAHEHAEDEEEAHPFHMIQLRFVLVDAPVALKICVLRIPRKGVLQRGHDVRW